MTVGHGWEAKLTGEVLILGHVIERLGLIIRILSMVNSGLFLTDVSNVVVKVYNLCRVSNYSNSASAVMDSWSGHTVPPSDFSK